MTGIAFGAAVLLGVWVGAPAIPVVGAWALLLVVLAGERRRVAGAAIVVVVGALLGAWRHLPAPTGQPLAWPDQAAAIRGTIATAPTMTGRTQGFVLAVSEITTAANGSWQPVTGDLCLTSRLLPRLGWGDQVRVTGHVLPLVDQPSRVVPYLLSRGCAGTIFAASIKFERPGRGWQRWVANARQGMSEALQRAVPGDRGVLLSGLVTGDDHALSPARQTAFVRTGTSHLTAVSGSNVAVVVTIVTTIGAASGWRRGLIWQSATVVAVWGYALLVGMEPPVIRAALVASAAMFATRVGRRPDFVTLTLVAAALMVAWEPAQLWRLSFQLSVASALALATVVPALAVADRRQLLWGVAAAPASAQVASTPILVPIFGTLSLVGLPANILIAPLAMIAFPLAAVTALLAIVAPPVGEAVGVPAGMVAEAMFKVVDTLGGLGGTTPRVGPLPRGMVVLIAIVAGVIIEAMSWEGQLWLRRLPGMITTAPPRIRVATVGLAIGAVGGIALLWAK